MLPQSSKEIIHSLTAEGAESSHEEVDGNDDLSTHGSNIEDEQQSPLTTGGRSNKEVNESQENQSFESVTPTEAEQQSPLTTGGRSNKEVNALQENQSFESVTPTEAEQQSPLTTDEASNEEMNKLQENQSFETETPTEDEQQSPLNTGGRSNEEMNKFQGPVMEVQILDKDSSFPAYDATAESSNTPSDEKASHAEITPFTEQALQVSINPDVTEANVVLERESDSHVSIDRDHYQIDGRAHENEVNEFQFLTQDLGSHEYGSPDNTPDKAGFLNDVLNPSNMRNYLDPPHQNEADDNSPRKNLYGMLGYN